MKIERVEIRNFRNIRYCDVKLWNINILTWVNSSWKSNFLEFLSNSLSTNDNFWKLFKGNLTTNWKWVSSTCYNIKLNVSWESSYHIKQDIWESEWIWIKISPDSYTYENTIMKADWRINKREIRFTWCVKSWEIPVWSLKKGSNINLVEYINNQEEKCYTDWIVYSIMNRSSWNEESIEIIKQEEDLSSLHYWRIKKFKDYINNNFIWNGTSWSLISTYVTQDVSQDTQKKVIEYLNNEDPFIDSKFGDLWDVSFAFMLADIHRNLLVKEKKKFWEDLAYYTDWIIDDVFINTKWDWTNLVKWEVMVKSKNRKYQIWTVSFGTAIIIFFVILKYWSKISSYRKSLSSLDVLLLDELDWNIHPSLVSKFSDLLRGISKNIQIIMTTHSSKFIDSFNKKDVYFLSENLFKNSKKDLNHIQSYESLISKIDNEEDRNSFLNSKNSTLFIDGLIDSIFYV